MTGLVSAAGLGLIGAAEPARRDPEELRALAEAGQFIRAHLR